MKVSHPNRILVSFFVGLVFFLPSVVDAGIIITEAMFDPKGSDTGREWVEVFNEGPDEVDITKLTLFEEGVKHKIATSSGIAKIKKGDFAIIADTPSKFLVDYPGFSGVILDSVFSLKNSGERLALFLGDTLLDEFASNFENLISTEGLSIQRDVSGFVSASSTPGNVYSGSVPEIIPDSAGDNSNEGGVKSVATSTVSTETFVSGSRVYAEQPQVFANFKTKKSQTVGVSFSFFGEAIGLKGEPLVNARYLWSFGDGRIAEGKNVNHIYRHPGIYTTTLTITSGEYSSAHYEVIEVFEPKILITEVVPGAVGYLEMRNMENRQVDISGFILRSENNQHFYFPQDMILAPKGRIRIDPEDAKILFTANTELLYPNGRYMARFYEKVE